jgi:hypothetical protein
MKTFPPCGVLLGISRWIVSGYEGEVRVGVADLSPPSPAIRLTELLGSPNRGMQMAFPAVLLAGWGDLAIGLPVTPHW